MKALSEGADRQTDRQETPNGDAVVGDVALFSIHTYTIQANTPCGWLDPPTLSASSQEQRQREMEGSSSSHGRSLLLHVGHPIQAARVEEVDHRGRPEGRRQGRGTQVRAQYYFCEGEV